MAIATVCLWVANYFVTQTFKMMDESPWLVDRFHHGFPFWIYAFFCAVTVDLRLVLRARNQRQNAGRNRTRLAAVNLKTRIGISERLFLNDHDALIPLGARSRSRRRGSRCMELH